MKRAIKTAELARRLRANTQSSKDVVLDQGPLQALLSWHWAGGTLGTSATRRVIVRLYPRRARVCVITVEVDPNIAIQRTRERANRSDRRRLGLLRDGEIQVVYRRGARSLEYLRQHLRSVDIKVVEVSGVVPPEPTANLVVKAISNLKAATISDGGRCKG